MLFQKEHIYDVVDDRNSAHEVLVQFMIIPAMFYKRSDSEKEKKITKIFKHWPKTKRKIENRQFPTDT